MTNFVTKIVNMYVLADAIINTNIKLYYSQKTNMLGEILIVIATMEIIPLLSFQIS
jgi:hypothetical protein